MNVVSLIALLFVSSCCVSGKVWLNDLGMSSWQLQTLGISAILPQL